MSRLIRIFTVWIINLIFIPILQKWKKQGRCPNLADCPNLPDFALVNSRWYAPLSTAEGRGTYCFGADPVGVLVVSFPCVIWTSGWILTKLAYVHCCEGGKGWFDFGDRDLIFKVTFALWNILNIVPARFLLNQWMDFDQICIDTLLGGRKEVIRFWWPWPNFQGHYPIKTVKNQPFPHNIFPATGWILLLTFFKVTPELWTFLEFFYDFLGFEKQGHK